MASDYLALSVFLLFALFLPVSLLLFSRLLRISDEPNPVSRLNFESGEESRGSRLSIMKEYFHYFSAFLSFEIITAIVLVWVAVAGSLTFINNLLVLAFVGVGFVLEILAILVARSREM